MKIKTKLLLKPENFKPSFSDWKIEGVLNPAAVRLPDKKILLYARIAESTKHKNEGFHCPIIISKDHYDVHYEKILMKHVVRTDKHKVMYLSDGTCRLPTISHFKRVLLDKSGFVIEKIENDIAFAGKPAGSELGVEDPRITKIGNEYFMTYVGISVHEGVSTYLASSTDLKKWKRIALIFREQNKDVVLFSEKIKGKYVALHRPETLYEFSKPSIWISYSPDLIFWGLEKSILKPRKNSWESERLGAGPPPIKTKKGWLLIYHGVRNKGANNFYSIGAALLDLKNPAKIIARTPAKKPLIKPAKNYEKNGFISNVIFPTGLVPDLNKRNLLIYSGGADSVITVRKINLNQILKNMEYSK